METSSNESQPAASSSASITRRAAMPEDEPFLFRLYMSARADEMAFLGWSREQQEPFLRMQFNTQRLAYGAQFPNAEQTIIMAGELPIGRMLVDRRDEEVYLVDITLLAEHRGAGIGTSLMRDLQREAARGGRPLRLRVMKTNRAIAFYERLGFSKIDESSTHLLMEWRSGFVE